MNPKDEFVAFQEQKTDKITFAVNAHGHVTHLVKRVELRQYDVFLRLQKIHCANLPMILDLVEQADCLEVHEEYIRGSTVAQRMQESGPLCDDALIDIAIDVCRALSAIHGTEPPMVHRDIKPENIMQRDDGGYVLIDFDAARIYREDASTDTRCIATVGYAAPEQYGLSQTDVRSDLFSLGVTLYELKTGEAYHVGAKCDGLLKNVIAKCTAFEPRRRYQSAEQLLKQLAKLKHGKRRPWIPVSAAMLALGIFGAVYFGFTKDEPSSMQTQPVAPALAAADTPCICKLQNPAITTENGLVIPFDGTAPVTVQLTAEGTFFRDNCGASTHIQAPELVACELDSCSLGAKADITADGKLTIYSEGVYVVSGVSHVSSQADQLLFATLVATGQPAAYTDCQCVVVINGVLGGSAIRLPKQSDMRLADNDGMITQQFYIDAVYDDRLCTASEHVKLYPFEFTIESAPEGANCGISDGDVFYTDTAGEYSIRSMCFFHNNEYYNNGFINFGASFIVPE